MTTSRFLACGLAFLMSACAAWRPPPPTQPLLRVGVTPDTAPYVFWQQDHYAGVEIDFATRLAAALGRRLAIVPVAWDEQIPSLLAGRTDVIMSGMSITPARASRVAFGEPYLTTTLQGVVRREDAERWPTPEALLRTSPRIGVMAGTTGEALVRQRRPDEQIVVYRRSRDAITELLNYRIDVYVSDAPVIEAAVTRHASELVAYPRVGEQSLAWAFRPMDEGLRRAADAILSRWRTDGTLRRVLDAWPSIVE
jgi:polar amino acid transport system substrate-binding protein